MNNVAKARNWMQHFNSWLKPTATDNLLQSALANQLPTVTDNLLQSASADCYKGK